MYIAAAKVPLSRAHVLKIVPTILWVCRMRVSLFKEQLLIHKMISVHRQAAISSLLNTNDKRSQTSFSLRTGSLCLHYCLCRLLLLFSDMYRRIWFCQVYLNTTQRKSKLTNILCSTGICYISDHSEGRRGDLDRMTQWHHESWVTSQDSNGTQSTDLFRSTFLSHHNLSLCCPLFSVISLVNVHIKHDKSGFV